MSRLMAIFNSAACCLRKVRRSKRFDRAKASRRMERDVRTYWSEGIDALFEHLTERDAWQHIQAHVQLTLAGGVEKALSDRDRELITKLLADFGYYGNIEAQAAAIIKGNSFDTFEQAAQFALGQLGVRAADFSLRNEDILQRLSDRKSAAVFATRNNIEAAMDTVVRNFYELGRNPYSQQFLDELRKDLGFRTDWEAKRFSLTETGIAAEMAQIETYRRNGVTGKRWNILGQNTRPTHLELQGVEIGVDAAFDVGGFAADHPCDPRLPAHELVNCHCWLSPVISDDFELDPSRIWEGQ